MKSCCLGTAAVVSLLLLAANIDAALVATPPTAQITDVTPNATLAAGAYVGNDVQGDQLLNALNDDDLFGLLNWTYVGKTDDVNFGPFTSNPGTSSGVLTLDSPIDGPFAISLKASNSFSVYLFENHQDVTAIEFSTAGTSVNGNGIAQNLSHSSLYLATRTTQSLPEPPAVAVWTLMGVIVAGTTRVRKRCEPSPAKW
jgi:hypothetical protein